MTRHVEARGRGGWRGWLRRLAPWALTASVVAYLLSEYSLARIVEELHKGDWLPLIPLVAVMAVTVLALVALWDTIVIRGVLGRPRYRDVLRGKAASSVLLALGYGFGHGGYAVWIARVTGAGVGTTAGIALYISAADLCALALVATGAIHLGGADVPRALAIAAPAVAATLFATAMLGPLRLLGGLPALFAPWSSLSRARQAATILGRTVNLTLIVFATWAGTRAFGLDIPLSAAASYLPVLILVGSLPINIGGFGPIQGAWLIFEPWAPGAAILAFQLVWHLLLGAGLVARGLPFMRRVLREIEDGTQLPA